jgi:hypothetical protein
MRENLPLLIIEILMLVTFMPMMLHESARPPLSTSIPFAILSTVGAGICIYQESTADAVLYGLNAFVFIVLALQQKFLDKKTHVDPDDKAPV